MSLSGLGTWLIQVKDDTEVTLASDVATITQTYHTIAAQSSTTDDLSTISLGTGITTTSSVATYRPFVVLQAASGDTITVKHGTGNISLNGAADFALSGDKHLLLFYNGSKWADLGAGGSSGGSMDDFTLAADSGTPETVADGNTVTIAGGTGIDTSVAATDTVTIAIDSTVVTLTGAQTLTNKTLTTPTIGDFTNATHNHSNAANGGTIDAGVVTYTPAVATDWDGDADPGDVDNALDQLAERVDDLEGAGSGGGNKVAVVQRATSTGAITSASWQTVPIDAESASSDPDGLFNIASNQIEFLEAGTYLATITATGTLASGSGFVLFRLRDVDSGTTLAVSSSVMGLGTAQTRHTTNFQNPFEVTANTTVEVQVFYTTSGGNATFAPETNPTGASETFHAISVPILKVA